MVGGGGGGGGGEIMGGGVKKVWCLFLGGHQSLRGDHESFSSGITGNVLKILNY
jgi:hypothetical protein